MFAWKSVLARLVVPVAFGLVLLGPCASAESTEEVQEAEEHKTDEEQKDKQETAPADEIPETPYAERVEVRARADDLVGIADSATEGVTGAADLEARPKLRPGEVVGEGLGRPDPHWSSPAAAKARRRSSGTSKDSDAW